MLITILAFIFVFGILVFVHELGHYLAAKAFKVRVDEFAFGFPPKIWGKKVGDTEYAINAIPIGGYVKLLGEVGVDPKETSKEVLALYKKETKNPANLQNKKPWQRAVIFGAGISMNILLTWLLLTIFYLFGGSPLLPNMYNSKLIENNQKVYISEVTKDTPAEKADIRQDDIIVSVDGKTVSDMSSVFTYVQNEGSDLSDKQVELKIERNGEELVKNITTYKETITESGITADVQRVGITMVEKGNIKSSWWAAPIVAASQTGNIIKLNSVGLFDFFKQIFTEFKISKDVGGPIAIAQISGAAAKLGFMTLIQLMAVLSVAVALLNILPFPALDGGHILFLGIEKILGKEISSQYKNVVNYVGFSLLLLLMAVVTIGDLSRIGVFSFLKGLF